MANVLRENCRRKIEKSLFADATNFFGESSTVRMNEYNIVKIIIIICSTTRVPTHTTAAAVYPRRDGLRDKSENFPAGQSVLVLRAYPTEWPLTPAIGHPWAKRSNNRPRPSRLDFMAALAGGLVLCAFIYIRV